MATESSSKRRKIGAEGREFKEKWNELYFFVLVKEKPVCLICNESVAAVKEYNIKRHYDTKHAAKMDSFNGQQRLTKVNELKKKLEVQQNVFFKRTAENEASLTASFIVAEKLAKASKPFIEGEFLKECMEAVAEVICPQQKPLFAKLKLSAATVTRRVEEIAEDIEKTLMERASRFIHYSVALDESTDITDTAQLAIFVRGIDENFQTTEEMAALFPMKGTTKGVDIFEALTTTLKRFNLNLNNLAGVTTDGAPAMVGKKEGAVAHLRREAATCGNHSVWQYHCIIHQENLCAKSVGCKEVMKDVVKTVNFIRSHGLNHREFQTFLREVEAEYGDVPYFTEVRWLSRGKVLKRVFDLRDEIYQFTSQKGKAADFLKNSEWMADFAFLVDISDHLNDLNLKLQGRQNLVHNLFSHVKAFEVKLCLWRDQIEKFNFSHFPAMSECNISDVKTYVDALISLKEEFNTRFEDFRGNDMKLKIFSNPFAIEVQEVPPEMQMELIEIQTDAVLEQAFKQNDLMDFYAKHVPAHLYPNIRNHALFCSSLFAATYRCEELFSKMKMVKSKARNRITDSHLENCLRISSSNINAKITKLAKEKILNN